MRWQYTLGILYCSFHLAISILHNMHSLHINDKDDASSSCRSRLEQSYSQPLIRIIAQLSGLHGSYGFYSPAVGSSYHSVFVLENRVSGERSIMTDPGLHSNASRIRYRSLLEVSGGWVSKQKTITSNPIRPLARALGISVCQRVAMLQPNRAITCSYIAHIPVSLHGPRRSQHTSNHILLFKTQTRTHAAREEADNDNDNTRSSASTDRHRPVARRGDDKDLA